MDTMGDHPDQSLTVSQTTTAAPKVGFFSLPIELRHEVYSYLIRPERFGPDGDRLPPHSILVTKTTWGARVWPEPCRVLRQFFVCRNRDLYYEAAAYFYRINHFILFEDLAWRFLVAVGPRFGPALHRIRFKITARMSAEPWVSHHNQGEWERICNALSRSGKTGLVELEWTGDRVQWTAPFVKCYKFKYSGFFSHLARMEGLDQIDIYTGRQGVPGKFIDMISEHLKIPVRQIVS